MSQPEFDRYSDEYAQLLKDPIRDYFSGEQSHFFHLRKRDLICQFFRRRAIRTENLHYLDLGCGKGELLRLLRPHFAYAAGCDPSSQMMASIDDIDTRLQANEGTIPFSDACFDFVTACGVFHHVPSANRASLVQEIIRVLKPGGIFAMIEHNPFNPVTRLIVSRTPVDVDAVLLKPAEAKQLMSSSGLWPDKVQYFLYFPVRIYEHGGKTIESFLTGVPLGGQYAVFGTKAGELAGR